MTDHLDPGTYIEENESVAQYLIERGAWQRKLTGADADNMHNLIRMYPTLTPDTSVGIIASGYQWDDPMLSEIVKRDANEVDSWFGRSLKATSRGLFTGMESWWQEGIPRALRTGVRMYQGEGLGTAYRRAGSSELARIAREASLGNPIQMGSGWLNRSTDATDLPGYREEVGAALEAGNTMAESFAQAELKGVEQYGTPITQDYTRVAESTLIHKTQNGVTASSPVSLGRLAAITVSMPDTAVFQAISGFIDFNTRILLDPIEMPIRELALAARARKMVVPQKADDMVRRLEHQYLRDELDIQLHQPPPKPSGERWPTNYGETYPFESYPGSEVPKIVLYPDELDDTADFLRRVQRGDSALGSDPGYYEALKALDEISQRVHGMSYKEYLLTRYGDAAIAKWDETITHELIHAEDQFKLTDRPAPKSVEDLGIDYSDDLKSFDEPDITELGKEAQEYHQMLLDRQKMLLEHDISKLSKADEVTYRKELIESREAINKVAAVEYDATFKAGLRMLTDESTMRRIRNQALSDAGLRSSWRPWLKPKMIEDWLHTDAGRRTIRFLANNTSMAKQRKVLKGGNIPVEIQIAIKEADNEVDVLKELVPLLGLEIDQIPRYGTYVGGQGRRLGAIMGSGMGFDANGPLSKMTFNGGLVNKIKIGVHRIGSKQTKMELNPFDVESSMDHATAWLHTIRASDQQVDKVLEMILQDSMGKAPTMSRVYNKMVDIYVEQSKALGLSDEAIEAVLRDFGEALLDNTLYNIDAAGNKIDDLDDLVVRVYNPISEQVESFATYSAVMESQTSQTRWVLPNVHEIRRATSRFHKNTSLRIQEKVFAHVDEDGAVGRIMDALYPEGLKDAWGIRMLDTTHALWRDWALLRVGWPMRVIPEEMLRQSAAGYSDFVTHPVSYIGLMMRHSMNESAMGDDFASLLTLQDLGSGRFRETKRKWDATRQSWTTARPGQKGYKEGLSSQFLQMAGDEVTARLARDGHEATLLWLATGEGRSVARRITTEGAGNPLLDLSSPDQIRAYLNRAEATQALYTGGTWIRRKADGVWVDMHGKPVPDWASMTKQQLVDEINRRRQIVGEAPITAKATSYTKERWLSTIVDESGIPLLNEVDDGLQYHIINKGNDDLANIIGQRLDPRTGEEIIFPEMKMFSRDPKARTMRTFADELEGIFEEVGVALPDVVRTPRNALNKSTDQYNKVVDVIFETLMAKPSAFLVRSPFFLQKYSEEMAKVYLFADDGLRTHLLRWADDNNVSGMFARHIDDMSKRSGFRKVPQANRTGLSVAQDLENMDRLAKSRSLQATRDLFYDLAERHNITDMTKHIFPFADAWFEVLSRWAKLLFANPEVAPRNWRRFQVGITNVRKNGFFSEDEYGRETFNWPGAGLMAPWFGGNPNDVNLQAKVGLDQLMFIDPNPRGLLMPGGHPIIQFPARMAQPHLEKIPALRNAVNWFAFGDFQQIEPQSAGEAVLNFAPSWVKQVAALLFAEEYKKEFGDDVGMMYEMLLASQNPQYGQDTIDQANATMDQANATVSALSYLKIVDRFFSPATPSYKAQILDEALALDDPMWLTAIALAREWTASLEFFGDTNAAREYFLSRFGIDPLDHTGSTFKVADAPTTRTGYDYLQQNRELYDLAPNTMMAWIDAPPDEAFFPIAWQRQKAEGQRVPITPEQRMWVINEQSGWHEWNLVKEQADRWESEIKASTSERSQERIQQMAVVQEWKNRRNAEIYETYWAWDNQGTRNNVGRPQRATPKQLWGELQQAGTPGTEAYKLGLKLDPAMSEWVVEFNKMVNLMTEYSLSVHKDKAVGVDKDSDARTWWLSSTSQDAVQLQTAFVDRMNLAAIGVPEATSIRIQYILERYVEPVFKDFDWDEELWLIPTPIPDDPVRPSWDDTIPLVSQEMAVAP